MPVQPLNVSVAGVADTNGNATIEVPSLSAGMFELFNAYIQLDQGSALVTCFVAGQSQGSAFGSTPQLGPIMVNLSQSVTFVFANAVPGANITIDITGQQSQDPNDLPGGSNPAVGNSVISVTQADGAGIYMLPSMSTAAVQQSGLLDVSQWQSIQVAARCTSGQVQIDFDFYAYDGVTNVGGFMVLLDGANITTTARFLETCLGPNLLVTTTPITGPATFGMNVLQSNRNRPGQPFSVDAPFMLQFDNQNLNAGNTLVVPSQFIYGGPAWFHYALNGGPCDVHVIALNQAGSYVNVFSANNVSTGADGPVVLPSSAVQVSITNNSGGALSVGARLIPSPTGST